MSVAVAVNQNQLPNAIDHMQNQFCVDGTLTLSGNYGGGATHGDTMDLTGVCPTDQVPNRVEIFEAPTAGNAPTGYVFVYAPGTKISNGLLVVMQGQGSAAPLLEITEGSAYPAALTAATANIKFRAWLTKFV